MLKRILGFAAFGALLTGLAGIGQISGGADALAAADPPPAQEKAAPAEAPAGNVVEPGGGGAFAPGYKKKPAAPAADAPAPGGAAEAVSGAKEGGKAPPPEEAISPIERAKLTPKGELKNPYAGKAEAVAEGKGLYFSYSCNGCHGGGGGGGMCPALTNDVWVYGDDDDTLFRLIAVGTDGLTKGGMKRKGRENVQGPMMPFGELIKTDQEVWKILAFVRSVHPKAKK